MEKAFEEGTGGLVASGPHIADQPHARPGLDQKLARRRFDAAVLHVAHLTNGAKRLESAANIPLGGRLAAGRGHDERRRVETRGFERYFTLAIAPCQHAGDRRRRHADDANDQPDQPAPECPRFSLHVLST